MFQKNMLIIKFMLVLVEMPGLNTWSDNPNPSLEDHIPDFYYYTYKCHKKMDNQQGKLLIWFLSWFATVPLVKLWFVTT